MAWKILLPQEIMSEGRKLLEDAGHTIIEGRGFETEDVLADMKEYQPDAMIVRITPITREVIEANPNLKVVVRHGAGFDALDVKACHDNGVQNPVCTRGKQHVGCRNCHAADSGVQPQRDSAS